MPTEQTCNSKAE